MAFAVLVTFIYALMAIGVVMSKSLKDVDFSAPLSRTKEASVLRAIVKLLSQDSSNARVVEGGSLAERLLTAPKLDTLQSLLALQVSPDSTSDDYYRLAQIQALFAKRDEIPGLKIDKRAAAYASFLKGEDICRRTNKQLRDQSDPNYRSRATLLFQMQRKITEILGPCPDVDSFSYGFGPGASVGCNRITNVRHKLSADTTATLGAFRIISKTHTNLNAWPGLANPKVTNDSRWTSVPKNYKTDRGINYEPIGNTYIQKGIGKYIRRRLKKFGIDLTDQSVNQRFARIGSLDGSLCTIDLSMASDTIAYNLVLDLLPWEWFDLLDAVRTPNCQLPDGTLCVLEKFSAMGNGYTFELESLIFYALLLVVCPPGSTLSVYGDDLIAPAHCYTEVIAALSLLGFSPNSEKSFGDGPFRESCGCDYWNGDLVRPIFIKDCLSLKELYRLHNYSVRTGRLSPELFLKYIERRFRYYGPDGLGDGHLIGSCTARVNKRGWDPFYIYKTFEAVPKIRNSTLSGNYGAFMVIAGCNNPPMTDEPVPKLDRKYPLNVQAKLYSELLKKEPNQNIDSAFGIYAEREHEVRYRLRTRRAPAVA